MTENEKKEIQTKAEEQGLHTALNWVLDVLSGKSESTFGGLAKAKCDQIIKILKDKKVI